MTAAVLGVFLVLTLASVIRTTAGFGFSLVAVPPLTLLLDPVTAVVVAAIMAAPLSLWIAVRDWRHVHQRITAVALGAGLAGVPFGVWLLHSLPARALSLVIAVVVLMCTLMVWRRVTVRGGMGAVAWISAFSGASFASTGIDGPPMVAAMQSLSLPPRVQRATLGVVFSGTSLASLAGFGISGQLTAEVGWALLAGVPALFIGIFVGERIFARFDAERFRRAVLGLLVVSSVSVLAGVVAG
ncbi:sulfite exporter TauE/SafE family protein [Streptomyces resistomycificus]|uniref:Probable membrane transporter protein n=1 Tax=Streptomyces resistomycificus TaxID=67356 RepID=A0A0L8KRK6_9ACTN|nr:sulfite exporter TauE/SafE family protein [Streptomyces resistomycificus]KOG28532.1 sulfite exporter TauE/SafE family protein [Streptomyces resistomycificus]KUN91183.1 sulfite transporter TauE/SafE [Streptomyces resistomycificus]